MKNLTVFRKEINDEILAHVTAGTNGYHGGDAGRGCWTYIELNLLNSAHMQFSVKNGGSKLQVEAAGNAELRTLIKTLKFMAQTLENQAEGQLDSKLSRHDSVPESNSYLVQHSEHDSKPSRHDYVPESNSYLAQYSAQNCNR